MDLRDFIKKCEEEGELKRSDRGGRNSACKIKHDDESFVKDAARARIGVGHSERELTIERMHS